MRATRLGTRSLLMLTALVMSVAGAQERVPAPPRMTEQDPLHPRALVETLLAKPESALSEGVREAEITVIVSPLSFQLDDGTTVVLRGLSVPEGERFREKALNYIQTKALGKKARLVTETPPLSPGSKVYAYIESSFLNEALARYGYAMAVPDEITSETIRNKLLNAQRQAEVGKLGIWEKLAP